MQLISQQKLIRTEGNGMKYGKSCKGRVWIQEYCTQQSKLWVNQELHRQKRTKRTYYNQTSNERNAKGSAVKRRNRKWRRNTGIKNKNGDKQVTINNNFSFWLLARKRLLQLSSVVPNPGSSDTSRLHHAAKVRPQRDQNHIPEVPRWRSGCHVCPDPQDRPPGPVPKKGWWWHRQSNWWLEGSEDYSETDHLEQTGSDWSSAFCLCPDDQSPQRTSKRL